MAYDHTQESSLTTIIFLSGIASAVVVYLAISQPIAGILGVGIAVTIGFLSFCFGSLRVCDETMHLGVRFGPLPVFRTRIPYSKVTAVNPARSSLIDGWGIHWVPGRGMIYNLWGFDCVRIEMGSKFVCVGTDDVDGLLTFLKTKLESRTGKCS